MAGVNKAIILGNLGKDPEMRYTPGGTAVASFSVATSEKRGDDEYTEWHNIVAFGRLAEICGEYLAKGSKIYLEGRIQTREWDDRDGNKRRTTEIIMNNMQMLGDRNNGGNRGGSSGGGNRNGSSGGGQRSGSSGGGQRGSQRQNPPAQDYNDDYGPPPGDDEIPF